MHKNKIYKLPFVSPAIIMYTLFFIVPVALSFYYSLTNWNAIKITNEVANYIGFKNFEKIFSDPELTSVVTRTIWFAFVTTIFKNIIGFGLALAFNRGLKSRVALRGVFFLPSMLSPLVIGLIFGSLFMTAGFVNQLLSSAGFMEIVKPWLTTKETALGTAMFVEIWRMVGFNMVIYLAGLQLIDQDLYKAASIDGANAIQKLWFITIPRMIPSIVINVMLNLSQGLKAFDIIFVLTGGGPNGSTELINTMVFREFGKRLYGMSAAYGVIMFVITAIFGLLVLRMNKMIEND